MSNQIETIRKLYAETKECKIPIEPKEGMDQFSIEITPLSLEDIGLLDMKEGAPSSELAKNINQIIAKSLKIEEEESAKISFEFMEDLLSVIMKANNLDEKSIKKTGIKEFIKQKQAQIKNQNAESNKSA